MTEQQFELERTKMRELRLGLLRAYASKLRTAIAKLRPQDATMSEVTAGLKMLCDGLRTEYRSTEILPAPVEQTIEQPAAPPGGNPFAGIKLKLHKPSQQEVA